MEGISGKNAERFAVVTASARNLPALTCGSAEASVEIMSCICPPIRSVSAGPSPFYGTCTMSTKGLGPALTDLMGGQIQLIISTLASALPQVRAGKLRPLAVTTARRSPFFQEVPTMDEAGVRGYEFDTWYGMLVPAGTPRPIVERLNK